MNAARLVLSVVLVVATAPFLCAQAPLTVPPVHRYSFDSASGAAAEGTQVLDSAGTAHGIVRGAGATFDGTGLRLPGGSSATAAYIDLPNGIASGALDQTPGYADATYELWVTVHSNVSWSRLLDFGTNDGGEQTSAGGTFSGTDTLFVSANVGTDPTIRFQRGGGGLLGGTVQDTTNGTVLNQKMHLVATYDSTAAMWKLYKNGSLLRNLPTLLGPDTIPDVNVWLGRSNWSGDANANATFDEFRVYNYALSDQQVLGNSQVGPETITSPVPPETLFSFDESGGTTAVNGSGGNAVTLFGGASFVAGQFGNALSLDGTTGYGRVANSAALNPATAMTISAWIHPTDWSGNRVIAQKGAGSTQYRLLAENGLLKFEIAGPTRAVTAPLPTAGVWSFVVATYDGAWLRLYVNGTEAGKIAAAGPIPETAGDLFIGTAAVDSPASEHFAGKIDDLRIYSRTLSAIEIRLLIGNTNVTISSPAAQSVAITGAPANLRLVANLSGALQSGAQWTMVSGPANVAFSSTASADTTVRFPVVGTYVLQVTNGNVNGNATAQVTVGVKPAPEANLALWLKLNESSGTTAADSSASGWNATFSVAPAWSPGALANGVTLSGGNYATLPANITAGLTNYSLSAWVNLNSVDAWARVIDFGTSTSNFMFLTPMAGSGGPVRYAIKLASGSEQIINGTAPLTAGAWTHVAVTVSGSLGILYVNGVEVGRNTAMTAKPSSLGSTTANHLGKSKFGSDPYLSGALDDVRIYRRALSATEVAALAVAPVAPNVSAGSAPAPMSGTAATLNGSVTTEGAAISNTMWSKITGPGDAAFANNANASTSVTFNGAGTYVLRLTASNANAETFSDLTVNVSGNPNIYDDYISSEFPGVTDNAIIGSDADPDQDGVRNLMEWALGLMAAVSDALPWSAGKAGLPVSGWWSDGTHSYLSLEVRKPIGRVGVSYSAETGDLKSWKPAIQVGDPIANGDGSETVTFRDTIPRDDSARRFIRLKLSQP